MFDQYRLKDVLIQYKQNFVSSQWGNEKYKWEAVKWFQDNWDVNASDFAEMLSRSLDKTFNLLASNNNFPKGMIVGFAKAAPEEVRAMFIALFDESKDVFERMDAFKMQSTVLLEKYGNGAAQHYQYENAISTYLWLRYPDKYYIYKFGEVKAVASELESDYRFKKGAYADNIRNFLKLYDEISVALKEDTELVNLFQSQLTDACYPDPELKTLTIDIGFYISRYYSQKDAAPDTTSWYGADFDPGLKVEDWSKLLIDETVFTTGALEIMKRIKDYGGMASCIQLAVKYGETKNFYNSGSVALARRVCEATGITPNTRDDGSTQWWTVLYTGRDAGKDEEGSFVWKLRDELSAALEKADLSSIELYVAAAPGEQDCGYWWLNANPSIWRLSDLAVAAEQSYSLYNENGNKRRIFQNFLDGKSRVDTVKEFAEEGITTRKGRKWVDATIRVVLTNNIYTGDLVLQKTFRSDPISQRKMKNIGELPRYCVNGHHEAIIDKETLSDAAAAAGAGEEGTCRALQKRRKRNQGRCNRWICRACEPGP